MADAFNQIIQERTAIVDPDTWVAVTIPVGARFPILGVEDGTASTRISYDNTLDPSTEGVFIAVGGFYAFEGVNSVELTVYISCTAATNAILQYTKE
jgi:hypothetical protein